jgi:predicted SnoaL-like aldol condensation-catalyzing enzyme
MKVIISESQYKKLVETGSNSAAMDLDIYVQPSEEVIDKLEELISMFKGGKKTKPQLKSKIYKGLDILNNAHSGIKYEN